VQLNFTVEVEVVWDGNDSYRNVPVLRLDGTEVWRNPYAKLSNRNGLEEARNEVVELFKKRLNPSQRKKATK
jgi:hypothetical protein